MRSTTSLLPRPSELMWRVLIGRLRAWADRMPESEMIQRSVDLGERLAGAVGRPRAPMASLMRGLAVTVYFRRRGISILSRLTADAYRNWSAFNDDTRGVGRAIFVTAHVGPFQLQMDLLSALGKPILFIYKSYRWRPLRSAIDELRLRTDLFEYVDTGETRAIAAAIPSGRSIAFLGDVPASGPDRSLNLFGKAVLDDRPARMAVRHGAPIFVGGAYTAGAGDSGGGGGPIRFGVFYERVDPAGADRTRAAYAKAMESFLSKNREDWINQW